MKTRWKLLAWSGAAAAAAMLSSGAAASATTTVVITSPAAGLTTPNDLGVVAYSYGTDSVRVLQIYLDGVKKTESVNPVHDRINALISTTTSSSHQLTVQALDFSNAVVGKTTITFATTATPLILSDIDQSTWNPCDPAHGCNSGGNQAPTPAAIPWTSAPNEDGHSIEFPTQNPAAAYNTNYWWVTHTPPSGSVSHYFKYEFDLWIPTGFGNAPQGIEWECQQTINGNVYNFGWQAQYVRSSSGAPDNIYKVYRYPPPSGGTGGWEPVNLPLTRFPENEWTHIVAEYHVDSSGTIWHDALTVSNSLGSARLDPYLDPGTGVYPSISHVPPFWSGRSNQFSNAFQLDVNGSGTAYHVFVDKMKLTYVP